MGDPQGRTGHVKLGPAVRRCVDKVVKISRMRDEPRVGNITLELSDTDRFEASERECRQRRRRFNVISRKFGDFNM